MINGFKNELASYPMYDNQGESTSRRRKIRVRYLVGSPVQSSRVNFPGVEVLYFSFALHLQVFALVIRDLLLN